MTLVLLYLSLENQNIEKIMVLPNHHTNLSALHTRLEWKWTFFWWCSIRHFLLPNTLGSWYSHSKKNRRPLWICALLKILDENLLGFLATRRFFLSGCINFQVYLAIKNAWSNITKKSQFSLHPTAHHRRDTYIYFS